MKTYQFMFFLTLLVGSTLSLAQTDACIMKGKTIAPVKVIKDAQGVEITNPAYTSWKNGNPAAAIQETWTCCANLKLNPDTRVCEDTSLVDGNLVYCKTNAECSNGEGCFPLREDDMFITDSTDPEVIAATTAKAEKYEEQMNLLGEAEPKPTTTPPMKCTRDFECESYKCEGNMCVANNICRLADKGEAAVGNIKCIEPYEKDTMTGICNDNQTKYYSISLGKIEVKPVPGGNQCQFELYPTPATTPNTPPTTPAMTPEQAKAQISQAVNLGVITTRAMEWLYSTTSMRDERDCLFTMKHMRDPMKTLADKRKKILKDFSDQYNIIENDFKKVQNAQQDDMTPILSPCGEFTTAHDIALRRATGLDYLCYMSNRNDLFLEYEESMQKHLEETDKILKGYETAWSWDQNSKDWTIGTINHGWKDRDCRGSPRWHKKIKRRWGEKYFVRGKSLDNSAAIDHKMVKDYLGFVGQMDSVSAANQFKKRRYWLLDPLMPGGINQGVGFDNFGSGKRYDRQLGYEDKNVPAVNTAAAKNMTMGLIGMHAKLRDKLISHIKGLNQGSNASEFIYEPEIPSSFESRGCVDRLTSPECAKFKSYVDTIQDTAFAQMLAYSRHHKRKYKNFFDNEGTWRRKLFVRYTTDLTNLRTYYEALKTMRTSQNKCLGLVIKQLQSAAFNTGDKGIQAGVSANNYYTQSSGDKANAKTRATNYNAPKAAKAYTNPYAIGIGTNAKTFSDTTGKGSLSGDSGAGSTGVAPGSSESLAARIKEIQDTNAKAMVKNPKLADKEKELQDSLKSAGVLSSGGGSSVSGTDSSPAADSNPSTTPTDQAKTEESEEKSSASGEATPGAGSGIAGTSQAGSGSGTSGGVFGGAGSGEPESESSALNKEDASGMSDEEKDVLAQNYERQKSSYETKEEDSLFQAVSKTYVRNLDKILTRKKKLEESSSSPTP